MLVEKIFVAGGIHCPDISVHYLLDTIKPRAELIIIVVLLEILFIFNCILSLLTYSR